MIRDFQSVIESNHSELFEVIDQWVWEHFEWEPGGGKCKFTVENLPGFTFRALTNDLGKVVKLTVEHEKGSDKTYKNRK